jgi:acetylornithine deacetylase/succinyl-diaminopimelate desuccinylase-like protein
MTSPAVQSALDHAHAHGEAYLDAFKDLLRIPSISTLPEHKADIEQAAAWIVKRLESIGFKKAAVLPTGGHPVVYSEWLEAGPDKPTVLVYAHYDVQPVDPLELWETPPFEPTLNGEKLYGRGVIDDKIGVMCNLLAFQSIMETAGGLPVNVKLMFEGEEESSSQHMEAFIKTNADLLKADFLLISDGGSPPDQPVISGGVRGILAAEVKVRGPEVDAHSGALGGVAHNPIHKVAEIIASFHDENGHILIPGIYDSVRPPTPAESAQWAQEEAAGIIQTYKDQFGDFVPWGEPGYSFGERGTARPTLDVNGIFGGFSGEGSKTIIPAEAGFKLTMRLVPDQDPDEIAAKLVAHIERFKADTVEVEVTVQEGSWPALTMQDTPEVKAVARAFETVWEIPAVIQRTGGSIPIMGMFQRDLGMPITTMGFGTGGRAHSPNEFLWLKYFGMGIDTAIHFYHFLGEGSVG